MTVEKFQLTLRANRLKNVAELGKTEVIKNTLSPAWTTSFLFECDPEKETLIQVKVVDEVTKSADIPMGAAVFNIQDIIASKGSVKFEYLKDYKDKSYGVIYTRLSKVPPLSAGKLVLSLQASGLGSKTNPYLEIRRTYDDEEFDGKVGQRQWPIYRKKHSEIIPSTKFETVSIDINALCDGCLDRSINVVLYDYDGKWKEFGSFYTTVNELIDSVGKEITLKEERTMKVIVDACRIEGTQAAGVEDAPDKNAEEEDIANKNKHDVIDPDETSNDIDEPKSNDDILTKENVNEETKSPPKSWFYRIKDFLSWGKEFPFLNDIVSSFESKVMGLIKRKSITNGPGKIHSKKKRTIIIIPAIATFFGVIIRRKKNNEKSWGGDSGFPKWAY